MKTLKLIKDDCCENEIKESEIVKDVGNILDRMVVRGQGNFKDKAIFLPQNYDYVIGKDQDVCGCSILVPLKKKNDCCK